MGIKANNGNFSTVCPAFPYSYHFVTKELYKKAVGNYDLIFDNTDIVLMTAKVTILTWRSLFPCCISVCMHACHEHDEQSIVQNVTMEDMM